MIRKIDVDKCFHKLVRNGFMMCTFAVLFVGVENGLVFIVSGLMLVLYAITFMRNISDLQKVTDDYVKDNFSIKPYKSNKKK